MILDTITKDPQDELDYDIDFSRWLPSDDLIVSATAVTDGTTASVLRTDRSDTFIRVWLGGGVDGEIGSLTVTITTYAGRKKEVKARVRIKENRT